MTRSLHLALATAAALGPLNPTTARAQTVATSFEELRNLLHEGQTVTVKDEEGHTTRGKVGTISQDAFELVTKTNAGVERKTFQNRVLTASVTNDPISDGAAFGALAGAGASAAAFSFGGSDKRLLLESSLLIILPASIGIGALVDGLVHHKQMRVDYARGTSAIDVIPLVSQKSWRILLSWRF